MKRSTALFVILLLCWLSTGFYAVGGNEMAVVRRFGKVIRNAGGSVALRSSGLHYDLPWPFVQVDRVNLSEVHTLEIGSSELDDFSDDQLLADVDPARHSRYLTGDKNILNVKIGIQYRIAEEQVDDYLFGTQAAHRRLRVLAEGVLSDLVTRSGVDFVHTLGRSVIQERLTDRVRELALQHRLGIRVDTVTLDTVEPPLRVRAAFLDVNDARADREKYVHVARGYAIERQQSARADAQQILDAAEIDRRQMVEQAKAEAESFVKLVSQFRTAGTKGSRRQQLARQVALQRMYIETVESILRRVKVKVILESGQPVDLTIIRDPTR